MKKCIMTSIIILAMIFGNCAYAENEQGGMVADSQSVQQEITVTLNGKKLEFDVAPQIVNNRTMLPMRAIFEALGAQVTWLGEDQIIFATKGSSMIVMKIGDFNMSVQRAGESGNTVITLDAAPFIEDNRTLVPVRAISEALGAEVDWVGETRNVVIVTGPEVTN